MVIEPKTRGFICTTAHPAGCKAEVLRQIEYAKKQTYTKGAKKVLVIGASTGYGLASRIAAAFGGRGATIGVFFDKPATGNRTASAGWYNTAALEEFAAADGLYAKSICGDAFSQEVKRAAIRLIQQDLGRVDCVIYSLASPRRTMPDGTVYSSVLKTTQGEYTNKTIDLKTNLISNVTIPQATPEEVAATTHVMGGEDWMDWMQALQAADVLEDGACTVAYSYCGPQITHPIYRNGSIGMAKQNLHATAKRITQEIAGVTGYVSVNKALVTQSSAAIPVVPLYISILYRVMKEKKLHEGCMEQMSRLYGACFAKTPVPADAQGLIRMDDWEMRADVQKEVLEAWHKITSENVRQYADLDGYWEDFFRMFGFYIPGIDYSADVEADVKILSIAP